MSATSSVRTHQVDENVLLPGQHSLVEAATVFSSPPDLALKKKKQKKHKDRVLGL